MSGLTGGQNYKRTWPKWKLEAQSSGRWRWLLLGDPFQPWKSSSVHKNDACSLALKGGAGCLALFSGVSTCLKASHEALTLKSHTEHVPGPEDFCSSAWPAPASSSQPGFGIGVVQQPWGCDPSPLCGDISAETFSSRFLLHLINKHLV